MPKRRVEGTLFGRPVEDATGAGTGELFTNVFKAGRTRLRSAPEVFMRGTKDIVQVTGVPSVLGITFPDEPVGEKNVYITHPRVSMNDDVTNTLGHEAQHNQFATAFMNKVPDESRLEGNPFLFSPLQGYKTQQYINMIYDIYKDKYKLSSDFKSSDNGFLATLVGIEASLPAGKTILDTEIGQKLFPDTDDGRARLEWYYRNSFPLHESLYNKPESLEVRTRFLINDTRRAMKMAKKKATDIIDGLFFSDPFGDTTRE